MTSGAGPVVGGVYDMAQATTSTCLSCVPSTIIAFVVVGGVSHLLSACGFGLVHAVGFVGGSRLALAIVRVARKREIVQEGFVSIYLWIGCAVSYLIPLFMMKVWPGAGAAYLLGMGLCNMFGLFVSTVIINRDNTDVSRRWLGYAFWERWTTLN